MLERLFMTLAILGGLSLLWFGWLIYKRRLVQTMQSIGRPGGKPTLLYFSADYCAPCKLQQSPIVEAISTSLRDAIAVEKYDVTQYPEIANRYKILTLPSTVILDKNGNVHEINYGVASRDKLEQQLQAL